MYELMIIAKGGEGADNLASKLEKHFKELEIVGSKVEKLGKKTLAYPIAKQTEGEFLLYHFETESGDVINQLAGRLKLEDELVLRYLITTFNPDKVTTFKAIKLPEEPKEPESKPKPKVTVTTRIRTAEEPKAAVKETKKAEPKEEVSVKTKKAAVKKGKKG